jgi:hypothetical protein
MMDMKQRSGSVAIALARSTRRRQRAAYTAVEVLMSLAVLAVGVIGIIATEKVTLAANSHAKNLAIATHIAQSWLGMLDAEGSLWDTDFGRTIWLQQGNGVAGWFRPAYDAGLTFGPGFDALGNAVTALNMANATFCVDLRLAPLTSNNSGGGLIRTEVRVIWLRNDGALGAAGPTATNACSIAAVAVDTDVNSPLFHFVYMAGGVRQVGL